MKRTASLVCVLLLSAFAAFGQDLGFGPAGASGISFQGGDPAQVVQRIMSSTRYKVTPGDVYQLSITVQSVANYALVLQENYDLQVPYLGTLNIKGMYFAELRAMVTDKLNKILRADFISLTLQSPARFDVAVFGGVPTPGMVTVNATQRVSDALILAGRLVPGASYRTISLVRGNAQITIDLRRYELDGRPEQNPTLEPGDRIHVPQPEILVTLAGAVKFPGTFEMLPNETLKTLLGYAGGTQPDANVGQIEVVRFAADGTATRGIVSLVTDSGLALVNGDRVRVPALIENSRMILVTGALFGAPVSTDKPVTVPLTPIAVNVPYAPGISLLTVLESLGGPTPYANAKASTILHKDTGLSTTIDVDALWSTKAPDKDIPLQPGDTVSIPIVNQVFVIGEVLAPGKLPYDPGMRVSDYLTASGGVNPLSGDANGLYFQDQAGNRTRTGPGAAVAPGAVILVDKNGWTKVQETFTNVGVVTGFLTVVITFVELAITFMGEVKTLLPAPPAS